MSMDLSCLKKINESMNELSKVLIREKQLLAVSNVLNTKNDKCNIILAIIGEVYTLVEAI